jgi:hypothetical protein
MERRGWKWFVLAFVLPLAACGDGGESGADGGGGDDDDDDDDAVAEVQGCDDTALLASDADPARRGPWPVGARTVGVAGLTTEVWYPAVPGSESGLAAARYDLREQLPEADRDKIPDEDNPWQACDCHRELPLDRAHGPYPLVLFVHGTAGFRTQTLHQMTHWASRGFVVIASDHPGIMLMDALAFMFGGDQTADATAVLDAVAAGEVDFLDGQLDLGRVALAGHSAGGGAIAGLGGRDGVQVLMPLASGGTDSGASLRSTLAMGGLTDGVIPFDNTESGYDGSPAPKRLVGIAGAGHLAFSDLCVVGRDQGGMLQVATDHGIEVNPLIAGLARDGCEEGDLAAEEGWAIIDHATTAALEETLHCRADSAAALAGIAARYPAVEVYREDLD